MNVTFKTLTAGTALALAALLYSPAANAAMVWNQGFETDTTGWFDNDDFVGYGDASRVASGTNGITSKNGAWHGLFTDNGSGPFSRFDGYRDSPWPGGMTASIGVYIDPAIALGEGFEYSVAANKTVAAGGGHLRDFIFHITKDTSTGKLLVAGSNNSNFAPREDLDTLNNYEVTTAGWYMLEHDFRDFGDGSLAVDLNLRDAGGTLLFTETRNNATDLLGSVVGGNRYGWFTDISVTGGIAVDDHTLSVVPEPSTIALAGLALSALCCRRRRRA
jgi:hypothetical protein